MRYSTRIKPISYFKANAAEVLADLNDGAEPMILTQNGEAKAVIQDIRSYEQTQETLAMLKILALGMEDIRAGRVRPAREVFEEIKAKRRKNDG
ncbi:type II toxin-antitoxin system Phd/YefM family antitoxin [Sphingobium sp.]|uniref:type II toxin-antitoxin system Phd/YefM family antitoxin n=1 Tax=Sphingobium sp. TaxID=1912891 RepID=UPI002620FFE0|nr:type II toxin-antitoxin system Phd/YefM family antitoxin [Sphingobium sp.]